MLWAQPLARIDEVLPLLCPAYGGEMRIIPPRDRNQMTRVNLRNWAALAEIFSAIAVVLSLVYVGLEIRRTTIESDADIQAEILPYTHQRRYLVINDGDLS